jgi:hypothetical protein
MDDFKIITQYLGCWVCVILFACVCVGASGLTTASDNPSNSALCVVCIGCFPRGVPRGLGMPPPGYAQCLGQRPENFFWAFFLFLVDFVIFSDLLN